MGAQPKEPEPGAEPLTLGKLARTVLSDKRLAHRYCMIAAAWKPDGSGDVRAAERSPAYKAARAELEVAARRRNPFVGYL